MWEIVSKYLKDNRVEVTMQDSTQANRLTTRLNPIEVESLTDEGIIDKVIESKINEWRPNLYQEQLEEKLKDTEDLIIELKQGQEVLAAYMAQAITPEQQESLAVEWQADGVYARFSFVRYEGQIYKLVHPKLASDTTPPSIDNPVYELMGKVDADTGLQELTPSSENTYFKGAIGTYEGRVYQSNYDDNGNTPHEGMTYPDWWEDLGSIEDYRG